MRVQRTDTRKIRCHEDIVVVRLAVRNWAQELGFSLVHQTKLITAASEIARNTLVFGGGGTFRMEQVTHDNGGIGLRLTFEDQGPGIADIPRALQDGYTTGGGMGLGLGGSRRLVDQFELCSRPGEGTTVTLCKWK